MVDVQPYKFTAKSAQTHFDAAFLNRIFSGFEKSITKYLEDISGQKVAATLEGDALLEWSGYCEKNPDFSSVSHAHFHHLGGAVVLRCDEAMIATMIDGYYGGKGGAISERRQPVFRSSELLLINKVGAFVFGQLMNCTSAGETQHGLNIIHQTKLEDVQFCALKDEILCLNLTIIFGSEAEASETYELDLVFSPAALVGFAKLVDTASPRPEPEIDQGWQRNWRSALNNVHLPIRTIVGHGQINLPDLFEIKVGDVLPVIPQTRPSLLVGNRKIAVGELGEKDGCAAYKIQTILNGENA